MQHGEGEMLVTETAVHHHLDEPAVSPSARVEQTLPSEAEEECFFVTVHC